MPIITEAFRKKLTIKINLLKKKNKLLYPGRDFVHIQDLLNIILKIIKNNTRGTAILNVGRGKLTYLDEIIKIFEKYVNKKIGYQKKLNEVGNYNYTLSKKIKLIKRLKYDYKFNLNDIIKSCIKKKLYDPT